MITKINLNKLKLLMKIIHTHKQRKSRDFIGEKKLIEGYKSRLVLKSWQEETKLIEEKVKCSSSGKEEKH
jgi:hypothetical protein